MENTLTGKEVPVMTKGKLICPAGSSRNTSNTPWGHGGVSGFRGAISRLRNLFRTAPAAMRGDSGAVMDRYMKYHREHESKDLSS